MPGWTTLLVAAALALAGGLGCNGRPGVKPFGEAGVLPAERTDARPDGLVDGMGVATDVRPNDGALDAAADAARDAGPDGLADALPAIDAGPCTGAVDGQACDDGNKCTQRDTCQAGQCVGDNPVVCGSADSCHKAGVCNPSTGMCNSPAQDDGTLCDDGDKCTQSDACKAGVCTGTAVVCKASDQCHDAGTCDKGTGLCSNPAKAENAACNDDNKCTQNDVCKAGVCAGTAVVCTASDQCHVAGACDAATGSCSNPAKSDGVSCDDGDTCTRTDTCQAGQCKGGNLPGCMSSATCKAKGECVQVTDCTGQADGSLCDDGNACTQKDVCMSGQCMGTTPVVCAAADQCHNAGTCDTQTGACSNPTKADGASCEDGSLCTGPDTCQAGVCKTGAAKVCAASDGCHVAGSCNPASGTCSNPAKADGAGCSDSDACTQTDTCSAGKCVGSNPKTCTASDICHAAGTCDPSSGTCSNPAVPNSPAKSCDDGNPCTSGEVCQSGVCGGGTTLSCPSMPCQSAGTCDRSTGKCSYTPVPDGTGSCSDGNPCTQTDACVGGKCVGSNLKTCTASDQCHEAGTCDRTSGNCSNPVSSNTKSCSDNNMCTSGDTCLNGVCTPTGTVVCAVKDCQVGTCDKTAGCTYSPVPDAPVVGCGGDMCNPRVCRAGVCVAGTAMTCTTTVQCQKAVCDVTKGCVNVADTAKDGTTCMTGTNMCLVGEKCSNGVCGGGGPPACNPVSDTCCGVNANGAKCNNNQDPDCAAVCGNGVVETASETCDTAITGGTGACPTANTCVTIGCNVATISGTGCQARCVSSTNTTCSGGTSDGCCPSTCSASNDADCAPTNDTCKGAIDISKGGVFAVDITASTKSEWPVTRCADASADVYYTFTLQQSEYVYLDLLEKDATAKVPLALELYSGTCASTATVLGCGLATNNKRCGGTFPSIDSGSEGSFAGKPLDKGTYTVVVKLNGGSPGRWALRFDHVPLACVAGELLRGKTMSVACTADTSEASCDAAPGALDASVFAVKCPGVTANFTTCIVGAAGSPNVDLSATAGTLTLSTSTKGLCVPGGTDGAEVACAKNGSASGCKTGGTIAVTAARSGLVVVSANSWVNADAQSVCNANAPAIISYPTQ